MISPPEYTAILQSDTFQTLIKLAQAELMNHVHEFDSEKTIVSAARAHDRRCGGELVLNFLVTQPTTADVTRREANELEPDFGAEELREEELHPTQKG